MTANEEAGASSAFDPAPVEERVTRRWLDSRAFAATPDERDERYVVMMPLPNVTGALHMGHAIDNTMQDLLVRWHRMRGANTLWMAGTDHAGIATQAVVEKRLKELEGKTRHDIGREALIERIWAWKDQYQARIVRQQQAMGLSCDWDRQRFTMDAVCARAVRHTFFRMFADGLIYRGKRLVNWDCELHTAVSDDEIYYESVNGHFWHLRYPVIDPKPGEPDHVVVATTRPETMLGDTAVACHPDPRAELERVIAAAREKAAQAPAREREEAEAEVARLEARRESHLPTLERLAEMAADGRRVRLPLLDRPMPLIRDEWAKPGLGSGCVKITPAHDPNDYEVWQRHADEIDILNILEEDGTLNATAGPYEGVDRIEARARVVADLEARGALEAVEDRVIEMGHSDRSKTVIEPYWSDQWFVRMSDVDGGVVLGRGTPNEHRADGLAQATIDAVAGEKRSPTGRKLGFHPDGDRYATTYLRWLGEKRDWCISRQLWWGHRIPIWERRVDAAGLEAARSALAELDGRDDVCVRVARADGHTTDLAGAEAPADGEAVHLLVCVLAGEDDPAIAEPLARLELEQSPDVLDTWFSSALWPMSTLGWPDPETAEVDDGQSPLAAADGRPDTLSYYYPGSCLITGRDIITLWVARMVLMGLYNLGDLPFTDCFVHGNIQDGQGRKMSKSLGNGIDPVDIIEQYGADALRYVMCDLQTGNQDIRLPVSAISPFTGELVDLATAKHGSTKFTYLDPTSGKEFDVLGTMEDVPSAKLVSERFVVGRNFSNKVWNAARFSFRSLEGARFEPRVVAELPLEDRWILSRLSRAIRAVHATSGSFTFTEEGSGTTYESSLGDFSSDPTGEIINMLNAFGYTNDQFEVTTLDFGNNDIGRQVRFTDTDEFGNMDLPDVSIADNFDVTVPTTFEEFAPFNPDGTVNSDAVRFNINSFSRTFNNNSEFYSSLNAGAFSEAGGFDEVGGVGGVPTGGGGIPELSNDGQLTEPFDAFSFRVFFSEAANGVTVNVNRVKVKKRHCCTGEMIPSRKTWCWSMKTQR